MWPGDTCLALDGELTVPFDPESLPSGDGLAGGTAVMEFTVGYGSIPAVSGWSLAVTTLLLLAGGAWIFHRAKSPGITQTWSRMS